MTSKTVCAVALALLCHCHALVASGRTPLLGLRASSPIPLASPQMILGGRSFGRGFSAIFPAGQKAPGRRSGDIFGCDGAGKGPGGDDGNVKDQRPERGDDEDESNNPFVGLWVAYEALLESEPLLMKALTSMIGFTLGDLLAQLFITKGDEFDWFRLFRLASFGFLVHGTTSHWFYGMLDGKIPGTSAGAVFTKVFIDQVLWNPIFGVMFFSYVALLERKGIQNVIDKVQNELWTQVTGSWKVWPLAHAINFKYIPSSQRVLYINSIQIGYNCFLSLISNRPNEKECA